MENLVTEKIHVRILYYLAGENTPAAPDGPGLLYLWYRRLRYRMRIRVGNPASDSLYGVINLSPKRCAFTRKAILHHLPKVLFVLLDRFQLRLQDPLFSDQFVHRIAEPDNIGICRLKSNAQPLRLFLCIKKGTTHIPKSTEFGK